MVQLVGAEDAHFSWLLEGEPATPRFGLTVAPGGVHPPVVIELLRRITGELAGTHGRGMYLIVDGGEVVGLCGYKGAPDASGQVEIGYGIAETRRRQGLATRAIEALLHEAANDAPVRAVFAETSVENLPSQRVLEANGFARCGERMDDEDGPLYQWRRPSVVT